MYLKNKIINYFVIGSFSDKEPPKVFTSPVTINAEIAKSLIEKQITTNKQNYRIRDVLHVCYDFDSTMLYIPNAKDFTKDRLEYLLQFAEVRITKDFGSFSSAPPIHGSPFSSLRIRSLNSFIQAREMISKHYSGKVFKDIPIIEAYLDRMPITKKSLPSVYNNNPDFLGGYIDSTRETVPFVEEIDMNGNKHNRPVLLVNQKTPFILIDTSENNNRKTPTPTEKEWVVLSGYRDYLYDDKESHKEKYIGKDINQFADLFSIKRYLYLGWPFEEICHMLMRSVTNPYELMNAIGRLSMAVESLKSEGYKNVAEFPYYISFQVDSSFPINIAKYLDPQTGGMNTEKQYPNFMVINYDNKNSNIIIETPVYIPPDICQKILKAKSPPLITKYNPVVNKIDVKTPENEFRMTPKVQLAKIKVIVKSQLEQAKASSLDYRTGVLASGMSFVDPTVYSVRYVSDYLYAYDYIKKICDKEKEPFLDVVVITGPIERTFGQGVRGGYMDENMFKQNNIKIPTELDEGVWMSPPVILINSVRKPSPADQADTIIHEYVHYIYMKQNPDYRVEYGQPKQGVGIDYEYWYNYFNDPNERKAHKEQIKFELSLGKSYDEIIRDKVEGSISLSNYPVAVKFSEMVYEVVKEMEEEEKINEKPT